MGAIFAIGNSVQNYYHYLLMEKYFINFSLQFLNHHAYVGILWGKC